MGGLDFEVRVFGFLGLGFWDSWASGFGFLGLGFWVLGLRILGFLALGFGVLGPWVFGRFLGGLEGEFRVFWVWGSSGALGFWMVQGCAFLLVVGCFRVFGVWSGFGLGFRAWGVWILRFGFLGLARLRVFLF